MKKKVTKRNTFIVLLLVFFPFCSVFGNDKMDKDIKRELEKRLEVFKKDYELSGSDLFVILRSALKNKAWPKGGLGIINNNIYAILASKSNELILGDKYWIGRNREITEIIIIDRNNKVFSIPNKRDKIDLSKGFIFVYFKPDTIKFIDSSKEYFIEYTRLPTK